MMANVHLDDDTAQRLYLIAQWEGRDIEELCAAAVAKAAEKWFRLNPGHRDPVMHPKKG